MQLANLGSLITFGDEDHETCLGYLIHFKGKGVYDAEYGKVEVTPEQADAHNTLLDEALLKGLDSCEIGQRGMFYVDKNNVVKTWTGRLVSDDTVVKDGYLTFRRAGKKFKGKLRRSDDNLFNFRRVR